MCKFGVVINSVIISKYRTNFNEPWCQILQSASHVTLASTMTLQIASLLLTCQTYVKWSIDWYNCARFAFYTVGQKLECSNSFSDGTETRRSTMFQTVINLSPANEAWIVRSLASVCVSVCPCVCLSVCLQCCNFWKPWSRSLSLVCRYTYVFRIVRSRSYVKVIESRSRSQDQKACLFARALSSKEQQWC